MYSQYTAKDIERFWGKVDKDSSPLFYDGTRCWEWKAFRNPKGYGQIGIGLKIYLAHRVSYEICLGKIPDGFLVLHHCDNPCCVRPEHLWIGTPQQNTDDMIAKGRLGNKIPKQPARGGTHGSRHKLSSEQVLEIRRRRALGESREILSKEFGVSANAIYNIVKRNHWTHI